MIKKNVTTIFFFNIMTYLSVYRSNFYRDNISLVAIGLQPVDNPKVCRDMNVLKIKAE